MKHQEQWTLTFCLRGEVQKDGEELLRVENQRNTAVLVYRREGEIDCEIFTDAKDTPLRLTARIDRLPAGYQLIWRGYRVELWADDVLADEEWPIGGCLEEKVQIVSGSQVEKVNLVKIAEEKVEPHSSIDAIQYWAPELGRHNVGDCMPFSDGKIFHLFYLKDRHQHQSKWGKGAHQFAHLSTTDLKSWTEHSVAVGITHQWEGSICTGSVLKANGKYYAFYAVRMADGSSARISWAVSDDCVHFVKSEEYFTLQAPYETVSVRDPEVFLGADGCYHMLLTTDWENAETPERKGCLAHLVSEDLKQWKQEEPFLVPGYTDQPECTDYFEWNGWYYLIFSNYGTAKYRYSRSPFGPWICPEAEIIDGLLYRVPKTAAFGKRRIAAGFLCIHPDGESYAGNLVLREMVQHEDGTLGTCFVPELTPPACELPGSVSICAGPSGGYARQKLSLRGDGIKVTIEAEKNCREHGILMERGQGERYELRIRPAQRTISLSPAHSNVYYHPTKRVLTELSGLEKGCVLELFWHNDILDLCVNGDRTLVCRLGAADGGEIIWSGFVKDGAALFR